MLQPPPTTNTTACGLVPQRAMRTADTGALGVTPTASPRQRGPTSHAGDGRGPAGRSLSHLRCLGNAWLLLPRRLPPGRRTRRRVGVIVMAMQLVSRRRLHALGVWAHTRAADTRIDVPAHSVAAEATTPGTHLTQGTLRAGERCVCACRRCGTAGSQNCGGEGSSDTKIGLCSEVAPHVTRALPYYCEPFDCWWRGNGGGRQRC